jgi:selenophosphate synthase
LDAIPTLPCVKNLANGSMETLWSQGNLDYVRRSHGLLNPPNNELIAPLLDPQTNGGMLVSVSPDRSDELARAGFELIGRVTANTVIDFS